MCEFIIWCAAPSSWMATAPNDDWLRRKVLININIMQSQIQWMMMMAKSIDLAGMKEWMLRLVLLLLLFVMNALEIEKLRRFRTTCFTFPNGLPFLLSSSSAAGTDCNRQCWMVSGSTLLYVYGWLGYARRTPSSASQSQWVRQSGLHSVNQSRYGRGISRRMEMNAADRQTDRQTELDKPNEIVIPQRNYFISRIVQL